MTLLIVRGWSAYYRTVVSSDVFIALDDYLWKLTYKWAAWSRRNKPKHWIADRYFGQFNKARQDRWVFGDRASGAYLHRLAWTKIVRNQMVKGTSSPDDPALADYWAERRRKGPPPPLGRADLRRLQAQDGRCPVCGGLLLYADHEPQSPREWEQWLAVIRTAMTRQRIITDRTHGTPNDVRLIHDHCHRRSAVADDDSEPALLPARGKSASSLHLTKCCGLCRMRRDPVTCWSPWARETSTGSIMNSLETFTAITRHDEPLAPYTWLKIGGPAQYFIEPRSPEELIEVVQTCHDLAAKWGLESSSENRRVRRYIARFFFGFATPQTLKCFMSDALDEATKAEFRTWGPGKYDPRMAASAVLPRRQRGGPPRRGQSLQRVLWPRPHRQTEGGSGGVSEVALRATWLPFAYGGVRTSAPASIPPHMPRAAARPRHAAASPHPQSAAHRRWCQ